MEFPPFNFFLYDIERSLYGFLDMKCLQSAETYFGRSMYLHRCLQHTTTNAKTAAFTKDKHGKARLKTPSLWKSIEEWIQFSAWLPDWEEFTLFWRHILERLHHSEDMDKEKRGIIWTYGFFHVSSAWFACLRYCNGLSF